MPIYIDKFKCRLCGKKVTIKSCCLDGSIYDYLCPKCFNEYYPKKEVMK